MSSNTDLATRVANLSLFQDLDYAGMDKAWLLKPEQLSRVSTTRGHTILGPFSYSTLRALLSIGVAARHDQAQSAWSRLFGSGFPSQAEREPTGEPLANVRSGAAYWDLLGLTATVLQDLAGLVQAIQEWRTAGSKVGSDCDIGLRYLEAGSRPAGIFRDVSNGSSVRRLFGYPSDAAIDEAIAGSEQAVALKDGVAASAQFLAEFFAFARTIYTDRLHRTQIRWKHRAAVFTPDAAPLWLSYTERTRKRLEPLLRQGIAVLDTRRVRSDDRLIGRLIIWPMSRESIGAHRESLSIALTVTQGLAASLVLQAENGRFLPLYGGHAPAPQSPLQLALDTYGGAFYSVLA